ncbi:MAG: hypothetical protein PHQ75_15170 [Thermoguttaceae bacterium]|nr:hypothetical protein [Thermoguttaceae bacterium]
MTEKSLSENIDVCSDEIEPEAACSSSESPLFLSAILMLLAGIASVVSLVPAMLLASCVFDPLDWPYFFLAGPPMFVGTGAISFLCYSLAFRQWFHLRNILRKKSVYNDDEPSRSDPLDAEPKKTRNCSAFLILMLVFAVGTFICVEQLSPVSGQHVSRQEVPHGGLPEQGSDFCFQRGHRGTVFCDFHISETDF